MAKWRWAFKKETVHETALRVGADIDVHHLPTASRKKSVKAWPQWPRRRAGGLLSACHSKKRRGNGHGNHFLSFPSSTIRHCWWETTICSSFFSPESLCTVKAIAIPFPLFLGPHHLCMEHALEAKELEGDEAETRCIRWSKWFRPESIHGSSFLLGSGWGWPSSVLTWSIKPAKWIDWVLQIHHQRLHLLISSNPRWNAAEWMFYLSYSVPSNERF